MKNSKMHLPVHFHFFWSVVMNIGLQMWLWSSVWFSSDKKLPGHRVPPMLGLQLSSLLQYLQLPPLFLEHGNLSTPQPLGRKILNSYVKMLWEGKWLQSYRAWVWSWRRAFCGPGARKPVPHTCCPACRTCGGDDCDAAKSGARPCPGF